MQSGCPAQVLAKDRRSLSDDRRGRCEQHSAGEDADGEVRARRRLGPAQAHAAVQRRVRRQICADRPRAIHDASLLQLWLPDGSQWSKSTRCEAMVLRGVWSRARSGRQCGPKHPRPVQVSDRRVRERVIELAGSAAQRTSRSQGTDRTGKFGGMSTGITHCRPPKSVTARSFCRWNPSGKFWRTRWLRLPADRISRRATSGM